MRLLLAVSALAAFTSPALGFKRYLSASGAPLRWFDRAIAIAVAPEIPESIGLEPALAAVRAGIDAWTSIDCDPPEVTADVDLAAVLDPEDEINSVVWIDDVASWNQRFSAAELARTIVIHKVQSGTIIDADIAVNVGGFAFSTGDSCVVDRYDLRGALTHELGHLFGLDHSEVAAATMAARSDPGDCEMRTLDPDDVAGFCASYDEPDVPDPVPEPEPEPIEVVESIEAIESEGDPVPEGPERYQYGGRECGECSGGSGAPGIIALGFLFVRARRLRRARRASG